MNVYNNVKIVEEVKDVIIKLKVGIKEIDSYYVFLREEK